MCLLIWKRNDWNSVQYSIRLSTQPNAQPKGYLEKQNIKYNWSWVHRSRCSISCMTECAQTWPHSFKKMFLTVKPPLMQIFCQQPHTLFFLCAIIFFFHLTLSLRNYKQCKCTHFHNGNIKWTTKISAIKSPRRIAKVRGGWGRWGSEQLFYNVMKKMLEEMMSYGKRQLKTQESWYMASFKGVIFFSLNIFICSASENF